MRLCSHDQLRDRDTRFVKALVCGGTGSQPCKAGLRHGRVAVAFPLAAAGEIAAPVADEALHILQRIPKKDTDLVGIRLLQAKTPGKLVQERLRVGRAGGGPSAAPPAAGPRPLRRCGTGWPLSPLPAWGHTAPPAPFQMHPSCPPPWLALTNSRLQNIPHVAAASVG